MDLDEEKAMFNPQRLITDAFVEHLLACFQRAFPRGRDALEGVLEQACRTALENLSNCDAAYHDINHTVLVTDVGQTILWGRISSQGDITPNDWVNAVIAMLFHDVGYLRGVLQGDNEGDYLCDHGGNRVTPEPGATDASMAPYHVTRSRMFVEQRFAAEPLLNVELISDYIEMTRFPVPTDSFYQPTGGTGGARDLGGLVRAADLIGQLADPRYLQKLAHLFAEFQENGDAERMGYANPGHLRSTYPAFFYQKISPYIGEGLRFLRKSEAGKVWVAQLYSHVYTEQHLEPSYGPERVDVSTSEIAVVALPNRAV